MQLTSSSLITTGDGEEGPQGEHPSHGEGSDAKPRMENQIPVDGEIYLLNTLEAMKNFDRKNATAHAAEKICKDILSGEAARCPTKLNTFVMLCYADLKKYTFYYWICIPVLKPLAPISYFAPASALADAVKDPEQLIAACQTFHKSTKGEVPCWIVTSADASTDGDSRQSWSCTELGSAVSWGEEELPSGAMVAFVDTSHLCDSPGATLRNLLFFLACQNGKLRYRRSGGDSQAQSQSPSQVNILCLREEKLGRFSVARSTCLRDVNLPTIACTSDGEGILSVKPDAYSVVGWEHNARGALGPRSIKLSSMLDPKQRAESAVDLNLKLMRWRALPSLRVDAVSSSKCLLLGAGTLGCAVARVLQGWGCRKITFVDSGDVAFSNPVRQSLFEFEDCLDGGKPKAAAAAEALVRIFPGADASGVKLSIPMPGYPVKDCPEAQQGVLDSVNQLDQLVQDHDIVFLLTDTRESRWLPTVQSLAHGKIAVSVALGFDTFLVMRHGYRMNSSSVTERLGCYFCSDVSAPTDSSKNRTLDQQCTVVRPGLAFIASALAVELVSSMLQHPLQARAPAPQQAEKEKSDSDATDGGGSERSVLGDIPHSIRGFLESFSQLSICCPAFPKCVACSETIVAMYLDAANRDAFLLNAFNDPLYLEDVTGLLAMKKETEEALMKMEAKAISKKEAMAVDDTGGDADSDDDFMLL